MLGSYRVDELRVFTGHGGGFSNARPNVRLEVWDDATAAWATALDITGNTDATLSATFPPVLTNRVRIAFDGDGVDRHLIVYELQLLGTGGPRQNVALGKPATASHAPDPNNPPEHAVNGNRVFATDNRWEGGFSSQTDYWLEVDLEGTFTVSEARVVFGCCGWGRRNLDVLVRDPATGTWQTALTYSGARLDGEHHFPFPPVEADRVRIEFPAHATHTEHMALAELELFAQANEFGDNPDRQQANTKEEDPTGLLNEGFRYRDLETGTFLTRDPLGFVDGPNMYAYVVQNPWSKFDPLGLAQWHHRYPRQFETFFESAGIDIHSAENGIILNDIDHSRLHDGPRYNEHWAKFKSAIEKYEAEEGPLESSAKRQKIENYLDELESKPKFRQFLRKGAKIPLGYDWNEYSDWEPTEKSALYKKAFDAKNEGKYLKAVDRVVDGVKPVAKVGGKFLVVVGVLTAPMMYGDGVEYAKEVYDSNEIVASAFGVGQVVLPIGPADSTATFDMTQEEVARGNDGIGPMLDPSVS